MFPTPVEDRRLHDSQGVERPGLLAQRRELAEACVVGVVAGQTGQEVVRVVSDESQQQRPRRVAVAGVEVGTDGV